MTENEIMLRSIAALTALRSGVGSDYVSDLLGEVIPRSFLVPADADAQQAGTAVLDQLAVPLSALVSGFLLAFKVLADAYDLVGGDPAVEAILQAVALDLARESD